MRRSLPVFVVFRFQGGFVIPVETGIQVFLCYFFFRSTGTRYFSLLVQRKVPKRKDTPVAGVTSEFSYFLPCPVLIRILAQQNRARRPWLALSYCFKKHKNSHTRTWGLSAHNYSRDEFLVTHTVLAQWTIPLRSYESRLAKRK